MNQTKSITSSEFQQLRADLHRANEALAETLRAKGIYLKSIEIWKQARDKYLQQLAEQK